VKTKRKHNQKSRCEALNIAVKIDGERLMQVENLEICEKEMKVWVET